MLIPSHRIKCIKENSLYEAKFCQNKSPFSNLGLVLTATHLPVCLVGVCWSIFFTQNFFSDLSGSFCSIPRFQQIINYMSALCSDIQKKHFSSLCKTKPIHNKLKWDSEDLGISWKCKITQTIQAKIYYFPKDCCSKVPQTGWLKQHKFVFSQL